MRLAHEGVEDGGQAPDASRGWLRVHAWPIAGLAAIVVSGMAFSFWWNPLTDHGSSWYTPSDLWDTFRASQYVGWGFEGEIYKSQTFFDSLPGIAVLFAPLAKLAGLLHLSESFPLHLVRPTAWLILGPADLVSGAVLLFPLDLLARRLLISPRRRLVLVCLQVPLLWTTVVLWGHPEYTLALAFGVYGLVAALDQRWIRVGVFFGLALVFQPLTLLMLPVVLTYVPARRWMALSGEVLLPSVLLLMPPLVKEWSATTYTLLHQPNYPGTDHPTPWISLAPVLQRSRSVVVETAQMVMQSDGTRRLEEVAVKVHFGATVAAGPERLLAVGLACAIGCWVAKKRPPLPQVVWWIAAALSLRIVFEGVMNPYYLMPGVAFILILAASLGIVRLAFTVFAATACTWISYRYISPWPYYVAVTGLMVVALASVWPSQRFPLLDGGSAKTHGRDLPTTSTTARMPSPH